MNGATPSSSPNWKRAWIVAAIVAALAWAGNLAFIALAGAQEGVFWSEVASDTGAAWLSFVLVVAAPLLLRFVRLDFARTGRAVMRHFGWIVAASTLFYALLVGAGSRGIAYAPDEMGAILQARTFAAGHITPRVAPELVQSIAPRILQGDIIQIQRATGRYTPTYWPGYALLMTPFALFGIEWACNPVITALSIALLGLLTKRLLKSEEAGVWAGVFALSSAQIALSAACYFSMPAHLLFNLAFVWFFINNTKKSAFVAGLLGGFALVLHNPAPHLSFALPWIAWVLLRRRAHIAPMLLGYALVFVPMGLGWSAHLGSFDAGQAVLAAKMPQQSSRFAEILARLAGVFRAPDSLLLLARGAGLCKFIVWATPGLAGLAWLGWLSSRRSKTENAPYLWLLGASLVFNFAVYFLVRFDQGHGWGFRYLHQSWLALPILGAAFVAQQSPSFKKIVALCCVLGLLVVIPSRALQMRSLFSDALALRPPASTTPSISFIVEVGEQNVWIQNDPFLRDSQWNLRFDSPAQNAILARHFLKNARQNARGRWGETWSGSEFLRSGSP